MPGPQTLERPSRPTLSSAEDGENVGMDAVQCKQSCGLVSVPLLVLATGRNKLRGFASNLRRELLLFINTTVAFPAGRATQAGELGAVFTYKAKAPPCPLAIASSHWARSAPQMLDAHRNVTITLGCFSRKPGKNAEYKRYRGAPIGIPSILITGDDSVPVPRRRRSSSATSARQKTARPIPRRPSDPILLRQIATQHGHPSTTCSTCCTRLLAIGVDWDSALLASSAWTNY
ncbi:uncharacterized protein CTHT_0023160 [Thermochaetoides thermophila DSM 1495]|uniref:Uncharacterized protein n=1 Tax=Chaetomium thermophilum (strain DSM 1495 / CBS 144.50 / IMI 039719) TaxID=759272 RepID=G0S4Q5_CHATD|nr:hypothetical protein CTHT_0023160 [Thermochaetoides thermophila DSM 1495]EGS20484.1 hypothetical protein CTHT_0023160 [Thermochaetoides thermophila DSM 1495]